MINQNRYSIFDRTVEKNGLKQMAGELQKGLITFSPLDEHRLNQIHKLNDQVAQRGEKLADMALGWLLYHKEVTSVLIGASRSQQILDNIKAISCAPFTEEELKLIDEISQS